MNNTNCENISLFHPGYYINDLIEEMEITQSEFAKRLDVSAKNLSDLINSKIPLSDNIAKNLSLMLGTSVDVWLNLQKTYDEKVIEMEKLKIQKLEEADLRFIDYSFFEKLGFVKSTRDRLERVKELYRYLCIATFSTLKKPDFLVQFRQGANDTTDERLMLNANAWVQTVINCGKTIETQKFNEKKLKEYLPSIREMTLQDPSIFFLRLEQILAECGVALVAIPSLKNSGVYGAVRWLNHEKVVLGISNRGVKADIFWFSFFHELGHVFQKKITKIIVDSKNTLLDEDSETEADNFARENLITKASFKNFVSHGDFSIVAVSNFAKDINIHPGIVVGRLQNESYIPYSHLNGLKEEYFIQIEKN